MNIFTKIKNNVEYAYYAERRKRAIRNVLKHSNDADDREWRKHMKIALDSIAKCCEIPIK